MRDRIRLKKTILSVILMLVMVALPSCQTFDSFVHTFIEKGTEDNTNVIYIGVIESKSGKNADKGNNQIKGIELAHKIYNNVNGQDISLIIVDDKSSTETAKTATEELIKMNPAAIIGSAGNATTLIASTYVGDAKIPAITPSATNPLIAQNNGYYFIADTTASQQGEGLAEYAASELGSDSIGIVNIRNESASDYFVSSFRKNLKAYEKRNGDVGTVVSYNEILVTDEKMYSAVKDIRNKGADTVLLPLQTAQANEFFKEIEKMGMTDITFLGTEEWGGADFQRMLKKHPDIKVAFPYNSQDLDSAASKATVTKEARRFQIEYERMYGEEDIPTQDAALGYDSYLLIINAIEKAKSVKGEDIRKALIELSGIHCATGIFEFDSSGTTIKSVNIATVQDGNIVPVYTTKSRTTAESIEVAQ